MKFHDTHIAPECYEHVAEVLDTGWLNTGPKVRAFEDALRARGVPNPVLLNNGTMALTIALAVVGVGPGDEVVIPPMTFIATGIAVKLLGATPVFCDVWPDSGNMLPHDAEARVTERTTAIVPVHWAGYPCDMRELGKVSQRTGVPLVADACQAFGATYHGWDVWHWARMSAFSLHAIKQLACGDGGLLACPDPEDGHQARLRSEFGLDWEQPRGKIGERDCDTACLGFKGRMNDLSAAVGLGNLPTVDARIARRRNIASRYRHELRDVPGLRLPRNDANRQSACHGFMALVEDRENFVFKLWDVGIPTSVLHRRIDRYTVFAENARPNLPNTERYNTRHVSLPFMETLTDEDVERVVATVRSGW